LAAEDLPGIVHRLTSAPVSRLPNHDQPRTDSGSREITREEKAIDRLRGDYAKRASIPMSVALKKKERKIDSLAQGFSFPFNVQYLIRVWDQTETGLQSKCAAIRTRSIR
jgi:hypothetical protein